MGQAPTREDIDRAVRGVFVVELVSASKAQSFPESSLFVRIRIASSTGVNRCEWVRSVARRETTTPVWHTYRDVGVVPNDGDIMQVELCSEVVGAVSRLAAGSVVVQAAEREPFTVWLNLIDKPAGADDIGVVMRYVAAPTQDQKIIYYIRHGESQWNEVCRAYEECVRVGSL